MLLALDGRARARGVDDKMQRTSRGRWAVWMQPALPRTHYGLLATANTMFNKAKVR